MSSSGSNSVWRNHANQWDKFGPPLRPSIRDGELMMEAVRAALSEKSDPLTVAILGVTPQVISLPWPAYVRLEAFDQSAEMIATVWRPAAHVPSSATQARWQCLPLSNQSVRIVVGDASLNALPRLSEYSEVLSELVRVLEKNGIVGVRCYIRPDANEVLEQIAVDAFAGKILGFHALKWRIAMALSHGPEFSVAVADILAAFETLFPDRDALARVTGWPLDVIDMIDAYRGANVRYNFPTMGAFQTACAPYFVVDDVAYGEGELAERCPTVRLRILERNR